MVITSDEEKALLAGYCKYCVIATIAKMQPDIAVAVALKLVEDEWGKSINVEQQVPNK